MPPKSAIMHHADSYFYCHRGTQSRGCGKRGPRPPCQRREQDGKNRPGEAESEKQANVTESARVARAAGPAHLVLKKSAEAVCGQMRFHHNIRQHHFITCFGDAEAKFEIVGKVINQRAQAADSIERSARHGQSGAESKMNSAFNLARNQHASNEVRADADGFKL